MVYTVFAHYNSIMLTWFLNMFLNSGMLYDDGVVNHIIHWWLFYYGLDDLVLLYPKPIIAIILINNPESNFDYDSSIWILAGNMDKPLDAFNYRRQFQSAEYRPLIIFVNKFIMSGHLLEWRRVHNSRREGLR